MPRCELGPLGPGHDLDALGRVDRGSLDRGQVEHDPRVPPDLAEAAPVDPGEAGLVVLGHGRLERDAAALLHPLREPARRAPSRPRRRGSSGRTNASPVPGPRLRVPADVGERGAGVLAVLRRDEPDHVLGLALPVDVLARRRRRGRAAPRPATAIQRSQLVCADLPDLDHDRNDTPDSWSARGRRSRLGPYPSIEGGRPCAT